MKKRKLILALLVLTLGVAVYLNWQFGGANGDITKSASSNGSEILGNAKLVNSTTEKNGKSSDKKGKSEKAKDGNSYFEKARSNREKARTEALSELKEIIDNVKLSDEQKSDAIAQTAVLSKRVESEANIENMIMAKGFDDCVTVIGDNDINVIVTGNKLSEEQTTKIIEIVKNATKANSENIKIVTAK